MLVTAITSTRNVTIILSSSFICPDQRDKIGYTVNYAIRPVCKASTKCTDINSYDTTV